ncbi:alpha/beta fold hydrolase [Halogeometricum limi]|uniref:Pimeloyl-ACP methyl ester carboxylesterase n=1 Tax=Halogeometricum limi TaxID=555875 RepID=A0A1I6I353_9EURY|nr:alpha/beta hydrolase [Halogeometricum limi]SFR61084.1 Pimeloyl-ACP methyl ester carboxylesterase [Halogeometricum limi]
MEQTSERRDAYASSPTSRTVSVAVDGAERTVSYADYGDPAGVPVLFFHGTPGSRLLGRLFHDSARRRGVRLLAPDRPGYGRSSPWPSRTLADTGRFVEPVLSDADVDRVGVVGFSGGGPHALAFAATHGRRVRRVDVVSGAVPPSVTASKPPALRLFESLANTAPALLRATLRLQRWVATRAPPSLVVSQYTDESDGVDDADADAVRRDFVEAFGRSRRGFVTEMRLLGDRWEWLPASLDVPVTFWHGTRDANVPAADARRFADRLSARWNALDGADHLYALLRGVPAVLDDRAAGR